MREKYLIVEQLDKGKIKKTYIFKDKDLDIDENLLKQYELVTNKYFNQNIEYFDKHEYKKELQRIAELNKKRRNDLER